MTGQRGKTPSNERLMPDPSATADERRRQRWFTFGTLVGCILLALLLNEINWRLIRPSSRVELGVRPAVLHFEPIDLGPEVAEAWEVTSSDRRFGGLSALGIADGKFVALTDSGGVIRFARPRSGPVPAVIAEVPGGPRTPWLKVNRDIEAMLADPHGRGWWAAFEFAGELWLYDRDFRRTLERVHVGSFSQAENSGIEGMVSDGGDLLLFAETGGKVVRLSGGTASIEQVRPARSRISDAAAIGGGRLLVIERKLTLLGFRNRLVELEPAAGGFRRGAVRPIPAAPLDNFEGLAVERRDGRLRLWLVSDDGFDKPFRTVLLAIDLEPPRTAAATAP